MSARIEFCTFSLFVSGKSALPIGVYKLLMQKVQSSFLFYFLLLIDFHCSFLGKELQTGANLPSRDLHLSGAVHSSTADLHMWGGLFHAVPEDFELPSGGLLSAFQAFMCANAELKYPPLRQLRSSDLSTANKKKRFSDYNVCCELIVKKVSCVQFVASQCM